MVLKINIDNEIYNINVSKKKIKHSYIRIDEDLNINVSTGFLTSKKNILRLVETNKKAILKMVDKKKIEKEKSRFVWIFGKRYAKIKVGKVKNISLLKKEIIYPTSEKLDRFLKNKALDEFNIIYEICFLNFKNPPYKPILKVRKMKTRWGVCNIKSRTITLNQELLGKTKEEIRYVVFHELCHLIHFNHSKDFWKLCEQYVPNYKEIRKKLKEG